MATAKKPKPTLADARHEAAHAVVSVRLGLPLESTSIRRELITASSGRPSSVPLRPGEAFVSAGYTTLVNGTTEQWVRALPDATARESLKNFGAQAGAGIVAEMRRGAVLSDVSHRDDVQQLVQIAGILGIGTSTAEPEVRQWIAERIAVAEAVLQDDGGASWDRVAATLARKQILSGDQVRALVYESLRQQPKKAAHASEELEKAAGKE